MNDVLLEHPLTVSPAYYRAHMLNYTLKGMEESVNQDNFEEFYIILQEFEQFVKLVDELDSENMNRGEFMERAGIWQKYVESCKESDVRVEAMQKVVQK